MKVIIVKGTYHRRGTTSALVDEFIKGIKKIDKNSKIEIFDLLDKKVKFCNGCLMCCKNKSLKIGKCPIKDDATKIFPKLIDADAIVFATPVYDFGPTALLKRFMERCVCMTYWDPYPKTRIKKIKGKTGIVILSAATPSPFNDLTLMTIYPRVVLSIYCGGLGCSKIKVLSAGGMQYNSRCRNKWLKKSYDSGIKVAKKFNSKKNRKI